MKAKHPTLVVVERRDQFVLISFKVSAIDERNSAAIADELEEVARAPRPQSVVIDMTGVRRLDVLGLAVLQAVQESIQEVGGEAAICGPTQAWNQALIDSRALRDRERRDTRPHLHRYTLW